MFIFILLINSGCNFLIMQTKDLYIPQQSPLQLCRFLSTCTKINFSILFHKQQRRTCTLCDWHAPVQCNIYYWLIVKLSYGNIDFTFIGLHVYVCNVVKLSSQYQCYDFVINSSRSTISFSNIVKYINVCMFFSFLFILFFVTCFDLNLVAYFTYFTIRNLFSIYPEELMNVNNGIIHYL